MFSLLLAWANCWPNSRVVGDVGHHCVLHQCVIPEHNTGHFNWNILPLLKKMCAFDFSQVYWYSFCTGGFYLQRFSKEENVSMHWLHHGLGGIGFKFLNRNQKWFTSAFLTGNGNDWHKISGQETEITYINSLNGNRKFQRHRPSTGYRVLD